MKKLPVFLAIAIGLSTATAPPVSAQGPWDFGFRCLTETDFVTLYPMIRDMLQTDPAGSRRAWKTPEGRTGWIELVSGGDKAGSSEATVRIIRDIDAHQTSIFTFQYRKDPGKGWAMAD